MGAPVATRAQTAADTTTIRREPVLGVPLGGDRQLVDTFLTARGWSRSLDSVPSEVGKPAVFAGRLDGRPAEIVAMFGNGSGRDRLINLVINLPAASDSALHATYAWAYRRMEGLRCRADLQRDYRVQLDSVLAGRRIGVPPASHVSHRAPLGPAHTTVESGNIDWPSPSWLTVDGSLGTQLTASSLAPESRWPFQVTLWTSSLFAVNPEVTICADTRAAASRERPTRVVRPAAPGETVIMDTLTVVASLGVHGRVDTATVVTSDLGPEDDREFAIVVPRGKKVSYTFVSDTGFEKPIVVLDDNAVAAKGVATIEGNRVLLVAAEKRVVVTPATRKLVGLMRAQLTSTDPLAAYVEIECEIEHLFATAPKDAERLAHEAQQLAIDPIRDRKALRRIDDALGGHEFAGCAEDRVRYAKRKSSAGSGR